MELRKRLDSLVAELSEIGLQLNAAETVLFTSQGQPPSTITTDHGITVGILSSDVAQN